jgi:crossover junction endodeoxyribonuclease RuvC
LRTTGYGAIERSNGRVRLIEAGVVVPSAKGTLEERLHELHSGICEVIAQTQPEHVVIEELYTTYKNPRSALLMGHARGVLCLASAQAGVVVQTLGHARVKRALVGSGSARKEQVGAMVARLLGLRRVPKPHDVSDALALALAFLNMLDHVR